MANHFKLSWINCLEIKILLHCLWHELYLTRALGCLLFTALRTLLWTKHLRTFQGLSRPYFLLFYRLHSVQKRALSLCLFHFFHNMSNFIPKDFLCLLLSLWSSVHWNSRTSQHRSQFSRTLRTSQGLKLLFQNSRTLKDFQDMAIYYFPKGS